MKLQPEIFSLLQQSDEHRQRTGVAIFADGRHDRRRDIDVELVLEHLEQQCESVAATKIAEKIHERETHVDVGLAAQAPDDRFDRRIADADQRLSSGVAFAGVLRIGERIDQTFDDLETSVAHEAVDDRLANAPVFVAEELEHEREITLVGRLRDEQRRFLPRVGIRRAGLFQQLRIGAQAHDPTLSRPSSSRFICTNCWSVSVKISVSRRTRNGTRDS